MAQWRSCLRDWTLIGQVVISLYKTRIVWFNGALKAVLPGAVTPSAEETRLFLCWHGQGTFLMYFHAALRSGIYTKLCSCQLASVRFFLRSESWPSDRESVCSGTLWSSCYMYISRPHLAFWTWFPSLNSALCPVHTDLLSVMSSLLAVLVKVKHW